MTTFRNRATEVDMVATYLDSDMEYESMLPHAVREYWRGMANLPPARFVYESVRTAGVRATMEELRTLNLLQSLAVH